jgi:hypothetical protein
VILYVFIFVICVFSFFINENLDKKNAIELLVLLFLCIISGTRYNLGGSDYALYCDVYNQIPDIKTFIIDYSDIDIKYQTYGWEKGFLFFNSLSKSLGLTFYGFTFLNSFIFYLCMYCGLKRYISNFNFLLLLFLYKLFFYETFIAMRQSLTIAIFFCSIKYLRERQCLKYYMLSILAVSIHRGAFIMFFLYFIGNLHLTKRRMLLLNVIFIPTIAISFMNIPFLNSLDFLLSYANDETFVSKATMLLNNDDLIGIDLFHSLEYFLVMFLVYANYNKVLVTDDMKLVAKFFLCLLPIFTIFRGYGILTREKDYFVIFYAIILYSIYEKSKIYSKVYVIFFTVLLCAWGYFRFILLFDNGGMLPYKSWIFIENVNLFN